MHLNYHFLKQLSGKLNDVLTDSVLIETFSQQKDELIIVIRLTDQSEFYIRATLTSSFTCLSFPKDFKRSRKNSVTLFHELIEASIIDIQQFQNERAFVINFNKGFSLVFKLQGNRSNLILFKDSKVISLFKSNLKNDLTINLATLSRPIERSLAAYEANPDRSAFFPTFGRSINQELDRSGFQEKSKSDQWEQLIKTQQLLESGHYTVYFNEKKPIFSLLNQDLGEQLPKDPIEALNRFYYIYSKEFYLDNRKADLLKVISKKQKQNENYILKSEEKLKSLQSDTHPKQLGDILMANVHLETVNKSEIRLFNFYTNKELSIRLNKKLSLQKNAENYYRKGKNRIIEEESIRSSIESKKADLMMVTDLIQRIKQTNDAKELSLLIKENELQQKEEKPIKPLPYNEFSIEGFRVWVGKNAKANDELTLKHRHKDDLWLHAKDVPGSHVLIKQEAGRPFTKNVIEKAAEIAAYYSKRKTDTLAPVTYTPVKFVRKRKGSPAGSVVVDKEKVLLVPPKKPY